MSPKLHGVAHTRELLRKRVLPLAVFAVLSAAGIVLGRMQYQRARLEWVDRAYRESSQLNGIITSRLDRLETQMLTVSTVFACSKEITRNEFLAVVDQLESPGAGFTLPNLAFVQTDKSGHDQIIFSTEMLRTLKPGPALLPGPAKEAMAQVGKQPSRAVISESFEIDGVRYIAVTGFANNAGGEGRLISLIPISPLFVDFTQLSIPAGLGLVVRESTNPASAALIDTREPQAATTSKSRATFVIRREVGLREWAFEWHLSNAYSGGPATGVGLMLITGLPMLGAMLAWLTAHLLRLNDDIRTRVEERTVELAETNASLEQTVHELGLSRYMLDKATTAIYLIDRSGRFIYVNECAAQYSGYSREELLGMHVNDINIAQTPESWEKRWNTVHALPAGKSGATRMLNRRKDGSTYPIEILAHHIHHEGRDYQLSVGIDITERERAEENLMRINARSDQALSLARAGYWSVILDDTHYAASPRCVEILGEEPNSDWRYSLEDWAANMEAADPVLAATAIERFRKAFAGEIPNYDALFAYKRKSDGRKIWAHGLGKIIRTPGHPPEMYGVIQDVTEIVEARRKLSEANSSLEKTVQELGLYRYMLDTATTAIYLIDRSGKFIYVNECAAQYAGYTREELLGMHVGDLNIEHTPEGWEQRWDTVHALPAGEMEVTRMVHRRKDGSTYPIEILAHHIRHEGHDYQLSVGIDISERERAEEELIRINASSDQALALTKCGYWRVTLDGSTTYTSSERTAELFGDPPNPEWRYGIDYWLAGIEAVSLQSAEETREKFAKACSGELPVYDAIYPYKRRCDGRIVWMHGLGKVIHRPGRPPEMYGVIQDVTEIVESRRELEEARKAAEKANQLKSEFLANMSHEIRTPMNGVLGMAELLSHTLLDADQHEQLAMLKASGEDLLTIINDILDFSKIEAGRMELETIGFSLHDMAGRTLQTLTPLAAAKKLEIELDIADDLPDLRLGDPNRLRQVLTNLTGNAIKFTERGWVRVVIAQGQGPHDLRVEVIDTGEGISPEAQTKLFQPFSQADASTTRKHGGTGLGLVISARIIEQMGGRTGVISAPGQGSTFWFELSLPPAAPEQMVAGHDYPMADALSMLAGKRVLLVDDNAINRAVAGTMMRRWGMQVAEAIDGPTALAQVRAVASIDDAGYDLAVLDGAMPGMDGWQLAAAIREIPGCTELPLVMASSIGLKTEHSPSENSQFRCFLIKPLRPAQLAVALAEALTGQVPRRAAPIPKPTRGARVLLVEDTKVNQMVARAMLEKGGHQVTLATNGVEALAQLEQPDLFDLILMDCQMPEMDGFEATRQLRLRERERGWTPYRVVAMTANAMQGDREACLAAGMDGYLAKPVQMDQLLKTVEEG